MVCVGTSCILQTGEAKLTPDPFIYAFPYDITDVQSGKRATETDRNEKFGLP